MFNNAYCKILGSLLPRPEICKASVPLYLNRREIGINFLQEWFSNVFNAVDKDRLKLLGPDCTCAEWLIRNGASVQFKGQPEMLSDYNYLITLEESSPKNGLKIEEIYAKNADINAWGFNHLQNCQHVKKITFIFCNRITNSALTKLKFVQNSLQYLEIRSCFNVSDEGIKSLAQLKNLTTLNMSDLVSVKNAKECEEILKKELPNCAIDFQK